MRRLQWHDYITINLFWLGLNIRNTAVGSIFMPYLVEAFVRPEIINTALGVMRTAGLIIAMLVQPAAGILSDRNTSRFGRRRPYLVSGVLLDVLFLIAIGFSYNYWMLFIAVLFIQISSNISHGPLQGLIPDLVPADQRGRASAVKSIFELIPLILVALTIAPLVSGGKIGWAVTATGIGLVLTMLLTIFFVKEKRLREIPITSLKEPMLRVLGMLAGIGAGALTGLLGGSAIGGLAGVFTWMISRSAEIGLVVGVAIGGLVSMVVGVVSGVWGGALATLGKDARNHSSFTWWIVNRLMFLAAVTSIQGFAPYFLMIAFHVDSGIAIQMTANLTMVFGICTLITALPSGWLADRIGRKQLVGASGIVAMLGTLILLVTTIYPNLPLMYVAGIIIGLAAGLFMTTNWALGTDLAPSEEAGRYLGISNLAGAGAGMIGAGIGGPIADLINRSYPGMGYLVIFSCYGFLFLLSSISLAKVQTKIR